jgi:hypothetical protein
MSRKPLLSESQVAKWMKLANIDKNATKNFLNESKSNKKVLKENYGYSGAREDEDMGDMGMEEDGMGGTEEEEEGGMEIGDGSMDDQSSVVDDEEMGMDMEAGGDEGEVEFDSVEDLQKVLVNGLESESGRQALKNAIMDALEELGLADDMGGDEEPEMDMEEPAEEEDSMEGGDEGGDEPAEPAEDEEQLAEGLENLEILTDNEIINEVLKRVIRRLV